MVDDIDIKILVIDNILQNSNADRSLLMTVRGQLEYVGLAVKQAYGFITLNGYMKELLEKDWTKENLIGRFTLVTKKSLAQKLEFGDQIISITKECIKVKKTTGKEWVFLNDKYICKGSQT